MSSASSSMSKRNSQSQRCRYDQDSKVGCTNANCEYLHPAEIKCRRDGIGAGCTNPKCVYAHPSRGEVVRMPPSQNNKQSVTVASSNNNTNNVNVIVSAATATTPPPPSPAATGTPQRICKFDSVGCKHPGCSFVHPSRGEQITTAVATATSVIALVSPVVVTLATTGETKSGRICRFDSVGCKTSSCPHVHPSRGEKPTTVASTNTAKTEAEETESKPERICKFDAVGCTIPNCRFWHKSRGQQPANTTPTISAAATTAFVADENEFKSDRICRFDGVGCKTPSCPHVHPSRGEKQLHAKLPDWNCPNCKISIYGSRPACRRCGAPNPGLQKQTESLLIAEKQKSKKLVEELANQLEVAKQAIAAVDGNGKNQKQQTKKNNGNDDDDDEEDNKKSNNSNNHDNAEKVISAAAAKLEALMAQINAAQSRLAVAEQAAAAGPSSIQVTPPPHWDEVSPVFPAPGYERIDITNQPVDPENGVMTTYKAAIEEFLQMAAKNEATGGSTLSNYSRVKKVERIQNDRLWVYYCSNRSLMRPSPTLVPGTSTLLPQDTKYTDKSRDVFRQFISQRSYGLRRDVNEAILFHGTSASSANIICDQGFDERVCNLSGLFGAGLYTASNPCKAFGYIQKNSATNTGFAFLARVCLGSPHKLEGRSDSSLRRPPNGFDSVVGTPSRTAAREFIVYDRRQTYPEYLLELE